jgi:hypothetical protein
MRFTNCAFAILLVAPIFGSGGNPEGAITVHEWGTFTTVADGAGGSEPWSPLGGTSDLPCFVAHLNNRQYKVMPPAPGQTVTVRMETPVLYFYAPHKTTVSVSVDFPQGLITEWYPAASNVSPRPQATLPPVRDGHIEWNSLQIAPGETADLPHSNGASHYYAARNADANLLRIGDQQEKLLFYRGIANFSVPLSARIAGENAVELRNTGDDPLALAVLFENRRGQLRYRVVNGLRGGSSVEAQLDNGTLDGLKAEFAAGLVKQGLYRKEADAMIATWNDSWFEEGMRVFYLLPQAFVDHQLPLSIQPAPAKIARVFVGREEILSSYMKDRLKTALDAGDTRTLDQFGRFLAPFMHHVKPRETPVIANYLAAKADQAQQEFYNPTCVK